jgi:hypothetical protein
VDGGRVWVGCDVGVFERRDTQQCWAVLGTRLPNVLAEDLLVYAPDRLLRVGTRRGFRETLIPWTIRGSERDGDGPRRAASAGRCPAGGTVRAPQRDAQAAIAVPIERHVPGVSSRSTRPSSQAAMSSTASAKKTA